MLAWAALDAGGGAHAAGLPDLPRVAAVRSCESLSHTDLNGVADTPTRITSVKTIDSPVGPFCRVLGTIQPSIDFEVDLPIQGWQQRYLQTGCGGLCGLLEVRIPHAGTCAPALQGGLALASDDMGHQTKMGGGSGGGDFGKDPQKRIDFAYRGNHVTALVAKALISAFYGQGPRYSYFSGCSDGGREGLVEAERFPNDFNGIAAGAPAMNFQVQNSFYHAWQFRSNTAADGKHILLADKLPVLHRAALAACDALDGLKDGLISEPRACHFDPGVAQCPTGAADTRDCLTPAEVAAARKLYAGPKDAAGHRFTIGGPQPGSELAWSGVFVPRFAEGDVMSRGAAADSSEYLIFPQILPVDGQIEGFAFTQEHFARLVDLHSLYDATDPDLAAFNKSGGKIILWHGWSDPHISPINTIAFYHALGQQLGEVARDAFSRLFLFPGMYHCGGGDGFAQFDILTPLMEWVEGGSAPKQIIATQVAEKPMGPPPGADGSPSAAGPPGAHARSSAAPSGPPPPGIGPPPPGTGPAPLPQADEKALRTRPVYSYPQVAQFSGRGSPDDFQNYHPVPGPIADPSTYEWEGQQFYAAGSLRRYGVRNGTLVVVGKP
jgi:feruloyl esterase